MAETIEEAVWDITGTPEVDRVLLQDEVKLYRARAVLAYLDSPHYDYDDTVVSYENPLPVRNEEGALIGHANIALVNGRIIGDVLIEYASPERLVAETRQGVRHYPRLMGTSMGTLSASPFVDTFGKKLKVLALTVKGITLSAHASSDERLQPLGEPVL